MNDIAKGRNFKKSLEKRGRQEGVELLNKVKTHMIGSQNRKKKRVIKEDKKIKKREGSVMRQRVEKGYVHSK